MKFIGIALIYVAFYSLIGVTCYFTKSAWPLLALILSPSFESKPIKNEN
jgi:hypothetical protein